MVLIVAQQKWEHWPDSGSESSEKRCWVPEWPHSAARSVLSQLDGRLFGTEQTRGNLRVSGLLVRLGLIGTAYRIILPVLWRDPKRRVEPAGTTTCPWIPVVRAST